MLSVQKYRTHHAEQTHQILFKATSNYVIGVDYTMANIDGCTEHYRLTQNYTYCKFCHRPIILLFNDLSVQQTIAKRWYTASTPLKKGLFYS